MIKIAICDDEKKITRQIEKVIRKNEALIKGEYILNTFDSGENLINSYKKIPYDLIFLDIEMEKVNGLEVGKFIREEMNNYATKIVYISSKSGYDRQLFDVQPLHFLSKPIDENKLLKDLKLAIKLLDAENIEFEFKIDNEIFKIPYKEIIYFESMAREIEIIGTKENYRFYGKIVDVENVLPNTFLKPHRSYLVNYDYIKKFGLDELILINGDIVPLSRDRKKEIMKRHLEIERGR